MIRWVFRIGNSWKDRKPAMRRLRASSRTVRLPNNLNDLDESYKVLIQELSKR